MLDVLAGVLVGMSVAAAVATTRHPVRQPSALPLDQENDCNGRSSSRLVTDYIVELRQ